MKDKNINYSFKDLSGRTFKFDSLKRLISFCLQEQKFWEEAAKKTEKNRNKNHRILTIKDDFKNIYAGLINLENNSEELDDERLHHKINDTFRAHTSNIQSNYLWSGHPYTESFVTVLGENDSKCADAFLVYVMNNSIGNLNDANIFKGVLFGYEFTNQDSEILKRRNSEKKSLNQLRNQLAAANDALFSEVEKQQHSFREWSEQHKRESEKIIESQTFAGKEQIQMQNSSYNDKLRQWSTSIDELEKTYEEKLRLKKPAEYWEKAAGRYSKQGWLLVAAIVIIVSIGLVHAQDLFVNWLQGKEIDIQLDSLNGVILFGSIAAIYTYVLRIFSRLAFSAFHLMRDAQEREQLTYLYLSLINESAIDEGSRETVLQALFGRSETGLLAQEHGPTMPLGDIAKHFGKSKS